MSTLWKNTYTSATVSLPGGEIRHYSAISSIGSLESILHLSPRAADAMRFDVRVALSPSQMRELGALLIARADVVEQLEADRAALAAAHQEAA